jgi:hypothetical protein
MKTTRDGGVVHGRNGDLMPIIRPLKRAALAAALVTGPSLGAGIALTAWTQPAAAADFTGKIPRVKIRKRKYHPPGGYNRSSNDCRGCQIADVIPDVFGYRTVVRTATEGAVPNRLVVSYDALDEGTPSGEPIVIDAPSKVTRTFSALAALDAPPGETPDAEAQLTLTPLNADGEPVAEPIELAVPFTTADDEPTPFEWAEGTGEAQIIFDPERAVVEVVVDLVNKGQPEAPAVALLVEEEMNRGAVEIVDPAVTAGVDATIARWVSDDLSFDPSEGRYTVSVAALDAGGEVGAEGLTFVAGEANDGLVSDIRLNEKNNGKLKLKANVVIPAGGTQADIVARATNSDGEPLGEGAMTVTDAVGVFVTEGLTFQDDPVDFTYALSVTFRSAEGEDLGMQDVELIVAGIGSDEPILAYPGPDDGQISLRKLFLAEQEDGTFAFAASVDGEAADAVASLQVNFEEPFEGPEPDELELLPIRRWTHVTARRTFDDPGSDAPVNINITVDASNGGEPGEGQVDAVDFSATAGVRGFGSGTKKSTSTTRSALPQLQ